VTGAVLADNNHWFVLELNANAAFTIPGLWMLAARSRHTLVHIPLRGNTPPEPTHAAVTVGEPDLVLSHHDQGHGELRSAGFSPSGRTLVVATSSDVKLFVRSVRHS
jgi:hypothetical protein